jgi:hypothetical protein
MRFILISPAKSEMASISIFAEEETSRMRGFYRHCVYGTPLFGALNQDQTKGIE